MSSVSTRRDFIAATAGLALLCQFPAPAVAKEAPIKPLRIGLGTYRVFDVASGTAEYRELGEVLKLFVAGGGSLVDSSPMYGRAERVLGDVSTALGLNDKLYMATKVWTSGQAEGARQIEQSFQLLRRKKIELFQIHNLVDWSTQLKQLRALKDKGQISQIGITHYNTGAFDEMARVIRTEKLDFLQIPYSLRETTAEKMLIPLAAEKGLRVIANEPFAQGALFSVTKGRALPAYAKDLGIESWAQFFLKFILSNKDVEFAIPGTGKTKHLLDNLKAAVGPLPSETVRAKMRQEVL